MSCRCAILFSCIFLISCSRLATFPDKYRDGDADTDVASDTTSEDAIYEELPEGQITNTESNGNYPSLVWTGSEFGVSWRDDRDGNHEIYFARIESDGYRIGPDHRITNDDRDSARPSMVWTGSVFGISWSDNRDEPHPDGWPYNTEIYLTHVNPDGSKIRDDIRITNDDSISESPSLVWTGSEFGIVWQDYRNDPNPTDMDFIYEIYFARVAADGSRIDDDVRITESPSSSNSSKIVWTGSEYGLSWSDDRNVSLDIFFCRVSPLGTKLMDELLVSEPGGEARRPSIAWTGSEYAIIWTDDRDEVSEDQWELYFARVSPDGTKIDSDVRITNAPLRSRNPSLTWSGSEYGVAWFDYRETYFDIYFARLEPDGGKIGEDIRLTECFENSEFPSIAFSPSGYGISWQQERDSGYDIYFVLVPNL